MMELEQAVGKLALVRYQEPLDADQLTDFTLAVRSAVSHADEPLVFCTDWRAIRSFPADIADTIVWIMRRDNPGIAANAVLVSPAEPRFAEQVGTILEEADSPLRRLFLDPDEAAEWLGEQLNAAERAHLRAFL